MADAELEQKLKQMEADNKKASAKLVKILEHMKDTNEMVRESHVLLIQKLLEQRADRADEDFKESEEKEERSKWRSKLLGGILSIGKALVSPITDTTKTFWEKLKGAFMTVFGMIAITSFMEWWEGGGRETISSVIREIVDFFFWMGNGLKELWDGYQEGGIRGAITAFFENTGAILTSMGVLFAALFPFRAMRLAITGLFGAGRLLATAIVGLGRAVGVRGIVAAAGLGALGAGALMMSATPAEAGTMDNTLFESTESQVLNNQNLFLENGELNPDLIPQAQAEYEMAAATRETIVSGMDNPDEPTQQEEFILEYLDQRIADLTNVFGGDTLNADVSPTAEVTTPPALSAMQELATPETMGDTQLSASIATGSNTAVNLAQELAQAPNAEKEQALRDLYATLQTAIEEQAMRRGVDAAVVTQEAGLESVTNVLSTLTRGAE